MQRLLQGRLLYLVLGLLVVILYARTLALGPVGSFKLTSSSLSASQLFERSLAPDQAPTQERSSIRPIGNTLDWWPKELDAKMVTRALSREPRVAMALSVLAIFAVGMWVGGFLLAVWVLWTGRIRTIWQFPSRQFPRWSFGEVARIVFLTLLIASFLPFVRIALIAAWSTWELDHHVWLTVSMVFLDVFVILVILTFLTGKGQPLVKALGGSPGQLSPSVKTGLLGYMAAFPWLALMLFLVVELARRFGFQPPIEPIQELIFQDDRPLVLGLTLLLACAVGPLAEELFFRGLLYPAIRQRTSPLAAMLLSGAAFSLVHTNVLGFLPIMAVGCLLAYLYERTGSLLSPLAVHVLHNTFLITLALAFRKLTSLT